MAKKRRIFSVAEPASNWSPIAAEIEAANRDKLTVEQLSTLLTAHRGGCDCARAKLATGLRWLIYVDPEAIDLEKISTEYDALHNAVGRLRFDPAKPKAKGPHIPATEVEAYVAAEIERSHFDYRREVSPHLHPPPSTKSDRKRRGEDSGVIKRVWNKPTAGAFVDRDEDGRTWLDVEKQTKPRRESMDIMTYEIREHVARTPDECRILECLESRMTFREIAEELGITKYRVEATVDLFRRRATEL